MASHVRFALSAAAALAMSMMSLQAHADIIYTYTSPTFAGTFTPAGNGPEAISTKINLELRLADHIPDGTIILDSSTLKSWKLDIASVITGETGSFTNPPGRLFVQGGKVVDWDIHVSGGSISSSRYTDFNVTLTPGSDTFAYSYGSIRGGAPLQLGLYSGSSQQLGTWVVAVPEPTTYGLAFAGLMVLAAAARRTLRTGA